MNLLSSPQMIDREALLRWRDEDIWREPEMIQGQLPHGHERKRMNLLVIHDSMRPDEGFSS